MATVSLITGTSTGIGHATALSLARAGHRVYAGMRNPTRAPQLADTAKAESLPITVLAMDVDSDASVEAAVGEVLKAEGRIDVLVNNAGIGAGSHVEETALDDFRQVMETNFFGALRCIKAVLPTMREQKSGCIVNVSSVSGRIAVSPQAAYTSSKHALEALSEVLAQEMASFGGRVRIVEPGIIDTPILDKRTEIDEASPYPAARRMGALMDTSRDVLGTPASVAGDAIRDIIDGDGETLRHPVGPDAAPYIMWRAAMSDEEFVAFGNMTDEEWAARVKRDFGLDVKL